MTKSSKGKVVGKPLDHYRARPLIVVAEQVSARTEVHTHWGDLVANRGEWIVSDAANRRRVVPDRVFKVLYESAADPFEADCTREQRSRLVFEAEGIAAQLGGPGEEILRRCLLQLAIAIAWQDRGFDKLRAAIIEDAVAAAAAAGQGEDEWPAFLPRHVAQLPWLTDPTYAPTLELERRLREERQATAHAPKRALTL